MDEIIVRVIRTVACLARLRILSHLSRADEMAPTGLARELGMSPDLVCTHLRRLASAGLIQRRRSGVWHHCTARSPYSEQAFSGRLMSWLCEVLRTPAATLKHCEVEQLRNVRPADLMAKLHNVIFEAATAFTNVRRVQILRRLASGDVLDAQTLSSELSMSESAVSRHTTKLMRRGYVDAAPAGRRLAYRLARKFKTPVHARLLEMVRAGWESQRTP